MKKSIGVIVQARSNSNRLPNKILKELPYGSGISVLERVLRRLKKAESVDHVIVATTDSQNDDAIEELSKNAGVRVFRGSEKDVLTRTYQAAQSEGLDIIVRVPSDKPCVDWNMLDAMLECFQKDSEVEYLSNFLEEDTAAGLEIEIFSMKALSDACRDAMEIEYREHVSLYIYRSGKFKCKHYRNQRYLDITGDVRLTLDTMEDYTMLCAVYDYLGPDFQYEDLVGLFGKRPWLKQINCQVIGKVACTTLEEELVEAKKILKRQGLSRVIAMLDLCG